MKNKSLIISIIIIIVLLVFVGFSVGMNIKSNKDIDNLIKEALKNYDETFTTTPLTTKSNTENITNIFYETIEYDDDNIAIFCINQSNDDDSYIGSVACTFDGKNIESEFVRMMSYFIVFRDLKINNFSIIVLSDSDLTNITFKNGEDTGISSVHEKYNSMINDEDLYMDYLKESVKIYELLKDLEL